MKTITLNIPDELYTKLRNNFGIRVMTGSAYGLLDDFLRTIISRVEAGASEPHLRLREEGADVTRKKAIEKVDAGVAKFDEWFVAQYGERPAKSTKAWQARERQKPSHLQQWQGLYEMVVEWEGRVMKISDALNDLVWLLVGMSVFGSCWWAAGATGVWIVRYAVIVREES